RRYPSAEALAAAVGVATLGQVPAERGRWWARRIGVRLAVAGLAAGVWLAATTLGSRPTAPTAPTDRDPPPPAPPAPPKDLRSDFGLTVAMVRKGSDADGEIALQPGNDGLLHLRVNDVLQFRIKVAQAAYVGVWSVNAEGTVEQLFPNDKEQDHRFR